MMHVPVTFLYPAFLWLVLLILPWLWLKRRREAALSHSSLSLHANIRALSFMAWLPTAFWVAGITAAILAMARPVLIENRETRTAQTRDIVVVVDISGSMTTRIQDAGNVENPRRIEVAAQATQQFIERRQGDRVALLVFNDDVFYHWPLTDELRIVARKAKLLDRHVEGGTNFEGPTDDEPRMGPIQGAINHLLESGKARTQLVVMVTDGQAPIGRKRMKELSAQMASHNIKLYVLGIGEEWTNPAALSTEDLRNLAALTGGQVFPVADAGAMQSAFETINELERSRIEIEFSTQHHDLYHYFIIAAIAGLLLAMLGSVITREQI